MKIFTSLALILVSFYSQISFADDAFSTVKCGADIPTALIGRYSKNERAVKIEAKHKDIGLEDLGAEEVYDGLNAIFWKICGNEYLELEDKKIRDVLQVPDRSKNESEFIGVCKIHGEKQSELIFAIVNNDIVKDKAGKETFSARAAWSINKNKKAFEKISTDGMQCLK